MTKPWCKNYRGMHEKAECEAGVKFADLPLYGTTKFHDACPCFGPGSGCSKAVYPTKEEMAAEDLKLQERFISYAIARNAIVESLGGPWKRGMPGTSGRIDCPVCQAKEALRFSRAGYNGHIHAGCMTEGCVRWSE